MSGESRACSPFAEILIALILYPQEGNTFYVIHTTLNFLNVRETRIFLRLTIIGIKIYTAWNCRL